MIDESLSNQLKQLVDSARTIFIIFPPTASADQKAVAASLYLALSRTEKTVGLISTQKAPGGEVASISGLEHTQQELGNQNLSISFPYSPDQVDKVSYHIGEESKRFFLSIKPKPGVPPLDASQMEFSYTGATADAVFLIGVTELESLDQLYFGYEQLYQDTPTVSINSYTTSFGTHKVDAGTASSCSEIVTQLIQRLGLSLDNDIATNLLYGIESSTKNLSAPTASAETFETVAQLLRAGARRSFKRSGGNEVTQPSRSESILHEIASGDEPTQGVERSSELGDESDGVMNFESIPERQKQLVESIKQKTSKVKAGKVDSKKASFMPPADYVPKRLM